MKDYRNTYKDINIIEDAIGDISSLSNTYYPDHNPFFKDIKKIKSAITKLKIRFNQMDELILRQGMKINYLEDNKIKEV